jgi:putative copper export protein
MHLIGRIFVIFFAFMIASLAAGLATAIGILGSDWPALQGDPVARGGFWVVAMFGSGLAGVVAMLPLFLVVVLAESFRLRSVLFYALAGVVIMLLGFYGLGFGVEESIDQVGPISHDAEVAAAAGAVFGFVYWALAGRNAGKWAQPRP